MNHTLSCKLKTLQRLLVTKYKENKSQIKAGDTSGDFCQSQWFEKKKQLLSERLLAIKFTMIGE